MDDENNYFEMDENRNSTNVFRKRYSLKPRSSIKEHNLHFDENESKRLSKKKITWYSNGNEGESDHSQGMKSPERSYSEAKTHYSDIVKYLFLKKIKL